MVVVVVEMVVVMVMVVVMGVVVVVGVVVGVAVILQTKKNNFNLILYVLRVTVLVHTIIRVQFVAQFLLTIALTCFGHRMWASSGSYKLHRSM